LSRSYKKVAGGGITSAPSDKWYKTSEHRRYRAVIRDLLVNGEEDSFPGYCGKYGNAWSSPKDGKRIWYSSLNYYLQTVIITDYSRTGEWYTPWWRENTGPIRRMIIVERSATIGDWKKNIIGK
jgi:hypothetical protein